MTMSELALKTLDFALEVKDINEEGVFSGWASTFGNVDLVGDVVMAGAFGKTIARNSRLPMFFNHNPDEPVGVWTDLAEKAKGLWTEGKLLHQSSEKARMLYGLLKAKGALALSIGYRVPPGGAEPDERRPGVTKLHELDLREISLVCMPANPEAKIVSVKGFGNDNRPSQKQLEAFLASHFCSHPLATAIAARALPVLRGDPEEQAIDPALEFAKALARRLG
jgi:hypothetical protein